PLCPKWRYACGRYTAKDNYGAFAMPSGIAVRIPNSYHTEVDCRIYRLYPALASSHGKMEHVAAVSPNDAQAPQTTVVSCEASSGLPCREVEVLKPWQRVPGRGEDEAALA